MNNEEEKMVVIDAQPVKEETSIVNITDSGDDIILLAEQAEAKMAALKKVMTACLGITTPFDWVIIGGKPYLQESGCTKVAALLGISFEIAPGFPKVTVDERGYKTYVYRVRAYNRRSWVEGEGSRSMNESFFAASGDKKKAPEEINERNVMVAALTNAKANAIKAIVPGLKNIEISTLENAGLDTKKMQGYTFNTGSQGGGRTQAQQNALKCEMCGRDVTQQTASYSQSKFSGHVFCFDCQRKAAVDNFGKTGKTIEVENQDKE